ncbi:MAG TPA: DUF456 domain-containing protein [Verrucomicrobiales bacterium]|nr:DUF456 domain-containing protein [Verrucomicrobiales bacterium]
MEWQQFIGLAVAWLIMLVGVIGCVAPAVPGAPLVFIGALAHRLYFGVETSASTWILVLMFLLMLLSLLLDYLASMYGAKRMGATWWGIAGAVLGGIIGLIVFNIPGALIGPFAGAFGGEMLGGRQWRDSGKAGVGATLGLLVGAVGRVACSLAMAGLFTVNVLWKLLSAAG